MKKLLLGMVALLALLSLSGCKAGEILYETRRVDTGETVQETFTDEAGNVVEAGTPIYQEVYELKPWVRTAVDGAGALPVPGADLVSLLAAGVLGIGSIWLNKRKRAAEKVSESLVRGIDVFRDALDRTEGGERIDAELKRILREHQDKLNVAVEVSKLLHRYSTPAKQAIELK